MKKTNTILSGIALIAIFIFASSFIDGDKSHVSGDKESAGYWGNTGSPGDGANCSACHSQGGVTVENTWISTNIPGTGYVAGQTYTITLTVAGSFSGDKGFSIVCEDGSNTPTGTLIATDNVNTAWWADHVSHKSAGITQNSWSLDWTAPSLGTGPVTFYAAFIKDGYTGGVVTASSPINEFTTSVLVVDTKPTLRLFPNPVANKLNIEFNAVANELVSVSIYSITGLEIFNENANVAGNLFSKSYDLSSLTTGIYFVKLTNNNRTFVKKIIVK